VLTVQKTLPGVATRRDSRSHFRSRVSQTGCPVQAGTTVGKAILFILLSVPAPLAGQHYSLEANPIHGTAGYGWQRGEQTVVGVQIAFGFPQLDRKLVPDDEEDLVDFAHVGVFARYRPSNVVAVDGALRLGLAELYGCSGCLPGILSAISGGVFVGGRNVKVGARLTGGVIAEDGGGTNFVVNLTPFALLLTLDR
jgi:hypothetical protein